MLTLRARALFKSRLLMAEVDYGEHGLELNAQFPRWEDAFSIGVRLRPEISETSVFGKKFDFRARAGHTHILYLSAVDYVDFSSDRHSIEMVLPRAFMREISNDLEVPPVTHLGNDACVVTYDPTLLFLAKRIRPFFDDPEMLDTIYADSFMWAFGIYMMKRYGDLKDHRPILGGLTTWQERLSKELIEAHLGDGLRLEDLAHCCDLRVSQFSHAFKRSVGVPPYQWFVHRRVERAKDLLRGRRMSLAEVANHCGFADQAHFTRVFNKRVGAPPAAWRADN
ncbi:AraC-like DNA-binding protein [Sphingomonas trueperi]|uniref:AraC family transcriptional regulator n=1 Tax=Sphingomonas trueperi TaxID=53317 RepID=UPI00339B6438